MLAICVTVGASAPSTGLAFKTGVGCHGPFRMPTASLHSNVYDAVQVLKRIRMSCSQALHIAARARWLRGLQIEYGSQFGAGGWGGPFHVGAWHCFVLNRGSDFIHGKCSLGGRSVRFYDHRQYWSIPERGWSRPTRNP